MVQIIYQFDWIVLYSQLSSTARGSSIEHVPVGPTKVRACKSILFTIGTPE